MSPRTGSDQRIDDQRRIASPPFWLTLQTHDDRDMAHDRALGQVEETTSLEVA